jgi:putative transposase
MKKSKFSESQIVNILKEAEAGISLEELVRQRGFSKASFYKWKAKYSGMSASDLRRLKELEEENRRLKQMYANLSLEHTVLKDSIKKNSKSGRAARAGQIRHRRTRDERTASLSGSEFKSRHLSLSSQQNRGSGN